MLRIRLFPVLIPVMLMAGCGPTTEPAGTPAAAPNAQPTAHVVLSATQGQAVTGRLAFRNETGGVRVTGQITGLQPGSEHGFHIHETGDCSAPDATSAGGHFNPTTQPHGHAGMGPHHAGDIPNQRADAHGVANVNVLVKGLEIGTGGNTDIVGRAVIVHAQPDDYRSQPSGNSGARIACGVIAAGSG